MNPSLYADPNPNLLSLTIKKILSMFSFFKSETILDVPSGELSSTTKISLLSFNKRILLIINSMFSDSLKVGIIIKLLPFILFTSYSIVLLIPEYK